MQRHLDTPVSPQHYSRVSYWVVLQEQGTGNSRAAVEVWEGSGQDAHDTVVHQLNLSIHRVETLQGTPTIQCLCGCMSVVCHFTWVCMIKTFVCRASSGLGQYTQTSIMYICS